MKEKNKLLLTKNMSLIFHLKKKKKKKNKNNKKKKKKKKKKKIILKHIDVLNTKLEKMQIAKQ